MFRRISKEDTHTYIKYLNKMFFNDDKEIFKEAKEILGCEERTFEHKKTKTYLVPFVHIQGPINVAIFIIHKNSAGAWYKGDHIYLSVETATRLGNITKAAQVLFTKRQ